MQTLRTTTRNLHSIHALPSSRDFTGIIEAGRTKYQFTFAPENARVEQNKLVLTGVVTVNIGNGRKYQAKNVTATLLATQGSASSAPPFPRSLDVARPLEAAQKNDSLPITEATGDLSSVGVLYFKLSPLSGKQLGLPLDLSKTQLNVRLYPRSESERDLQWLYSALVLVTLGESRDEKKVESYVAEINRIFKT
ncbi:MAG: hypothetical protein L0220_34350 [Acidobacteria bacterium]|nr:hypothetical protein [Acidobacteriota bacterium]